MRPSFFLYDHFSEIAPDNIFIYTSQKLYSYKAAIEEINRLAASLRKIEINSKYAAVISNNNPDLIFLIMALWQTGIVPVMINTRLTNDEVEEILNLSGCGIVFCYKDISAESEFTVPVKTYPLEYSGTEKVLNRNINPDDTAVIIFTSGTTGKPKGVELTFRTLFEAASLQHKYLKEESGDKWLASLPFYHIGGFSMLSRSIFNKTSIVIPESTGIEELCKTVTEFHPEYISIVGTQLKKMLDIDFYPGDQIKQVLIGGGFTDKKIISEAIARGWNITRVYGSTETAAFIAAAGKDDLIKFPDATGKEIIADSIYILDENKNPVINLEGEIALKNIPVMKSYLNDPASAQSKFHSGFFLSGDIGFINDEGLLFVLMRRGDMIVSGGENINLQEVEIHLKLLSGIEDAYVFAMPDMEWGQIPAAAICCSSHISENEIRKELKKKIAGYKIPKKIFFLKEIPRNEIGKVQLSSLKKILNIPSA